MNRMALVLFSMLFIGGCASDAVCPECSPASSELQAIAGRTFLVSRLSFPPAGNGDPAEITAVGLDLDGYDSGIGSMSLEVDCATYQPDHKSELGLSGIDNAGQGLVSVGEALSDDGPTFDGELARAVSEGRIQWAIRIDALPVDAPAPSTLGMEFFVVEGTIERSADGTPEGGQTLTAHRVARVEARTREGGIWGYVDEPANMEVVGDDVFLLPFDQFQLGGWALQAQADPGVVRGQLAGSFSVDALVDRAVEVGNVRSTETSIVRSIFESVADLRPRASDDQLCDFISVGFAFEGVQVELVE